MDKLSWAEAFSVVLKHLKVEIPENFPDPQEKKEVSAAFRGSAFLIRRMRGGLSSLGQGIESALIRQQDGSWFAVALHDGEAFFLDQNAKKSAVLTPEALADTDFGYIVERRLVGKLEVAGFFQTHKKKILLIMASGFLTNIFALALPLFSSFVYDKILYNNIHETLWALAVGLIFIALLDVSIRMIRFQLAERFAVETETDIDRQAFGGLLSASWQELPSLGRFLDRYKRLVSCRDMVSSTYVLSLVDVPFILFFALAFFVAAGPLVLVPVLFGFVMLLGNFLASVPSIDYDRRSRDSEEVKFRLLTDVMAAQEYIRGSNLSVECRARWRQACLTASTNQALSRYWKGASVSFSSMVAFLSYAFILVGGVYLIDAHLLTSGGLLAASMLGSRMMSGFSSVSTVVLKYRDFVVSLREMKEILPDTSRSVSCEESGLHNISGRISLDRVTCRLSSEHPAILQDVSARTAHGEMIGIAGIPGSGKTTLLRLIAGIVVPEQGQILIDHYPVSSLKQPELSSAIGYKPQDICLIDGTIEENVRAGRGPLSSEQREAILRLSGLGWVFQQGGLNWSTPVGPRGAHLSGGQRQLVALARAMHNIPPILLLDEPTNGLDSHLEKHLALQLEKLKGHSTIIVSTHNRSILSVCDRIIVIGDSRFVADGPKDKILVA